MLLDIYHNKYVLLMNKSLQINAYSVLTFSALIVWDLLWKSSKNS